MSLDFESLRRQYQPRPVKILFVGESPPAGETFFYSANSNLYQATLRGFRRAIPEVGAPGADFLRWFESSGCFVEDLCLEPVNHLLDKERRLAHRLARAGLVQRLRDLNPRAILCVKKDIWSVVHQARVEAGLGSIPFVGLPFPAQGNQPKYQRRLAAAIRLLRRRQIF